MAPVVKVEGLTQAQCMAMRVNLQNQLGQVAEAMAAEASAHRARQAAVSTTYFVDVLAGLRFYAAQGKTVEQAKDMFKKGLAQVIRPAGADRTDKHGRWVIGVVISDKLKNTQAELIKQTALIDRFLQIYGLIAGSDCTTVSPCQTKTEYLEFVRKILTTAVYDVPAVYSCGPCQLCVFEGQLYALYNRALREFGHEKQATEFLWTTC